MTTHLDSLTPAQLAAIRARLATRTEPTVAQIQKAQAVDDEWRRQGWSVAQGLARVLAALDEAERERTALVAEVARWRFDPSANDLGIADVEARLRHPYYALQVQHNEWRSRADAHRMRADAAEDALGDIAAMVAGTMPVPDDPWVGGEEARPMLADALNGVSEMVRERDRYCALLVRVVKAWAALLRGHGVADYDDIHDVHDEIKAALAGGTP